MADTKCAPAARGLRERFGGPTDSELERLVSIATSAVRRESARRLNKVPVITATFWVIKVLSTTIGETFSDYLTVNVGLGPLVTDGVVFLALAAAMGWQLRTTKYT